MAKFNVNLNSIALDLTVAPVVLAASGETIIIPASPATIVRVYKLALVVGATACEVTFVDTDGNDLWPAISLAASATMVLDFDTQPWFTCAPGAGFSIELNTTASVTGAVYYTRHD